MAEEATNELANGEAPAEQPPAEPTPIDGGDDQKAAEKAAADQEKAEQEATEQKPWYRERFDKLTRQKYEKDRIIEQERQRAERLEAELKQIKQAQEKKEPAPVIGSPRPTLESFEYDQEKYFDALTDWKLAQREAQQMEARKRIEAEQNAQKERMTFEQKRASLVGSGVKKFKDWEEVVYSIPGAIMHKNLAEALMEVPNGESVAYYFGKNIVDAERVSKLSPYAMAAELGKIEAKLSTKDKKTTSAPPPPNPLGGGSPSGGIPDPDKDPQGWIRARNEGKI